MDSVEAAVELLAKTAVVRRREKRADFDLNKLNPMPWLQENAIKPFGNAVADRVVNPMLGDMKDQAGTTARSALTGGIYGGLGGMALGGGLGLISDFMRPRRRRRPISSLLTGGLLGGIAGGVGGAAYNSWGDLQKLMRGEGQVKPGDKDKDKVTAGFGEGDPPPPKDLKDRAYEFGDENPWLGLPPRIHRATSGIGNSIPGVGKGIGEWWREPMDQNTAAGVAGTVAGAELGGSFINWAVSRYGANPENLRAAIEANSKEFQRLPAPTQEALRRLSTADDATVRTVMKNPTGYLQQLEGKLQDLQAKPQTGWRSWLPQNWRAQSRISGVENQLKELADRGLTTQVSGGDVHTLAQRAEETALQAARGELEGAAKIKADALSAKPSFQEFAARIRTPGTGGGMDASQLKALRNAVTYIERSVPPEQQEAAFAKLLQGRPAAMKSWTASSTPQMLNAMGNYLPGTKSPVQVPGASAYFQSLLARAGNADPAIADAARAEANALGSYLQGEYSRGLASGKIPETIPAALGKQQVKLPVAMVEDLINTKGRMEPALPGKILQELAKATPAQPASITPDAVQLRALANSLFAPGAPGAKPGVLDAFVKGRTAADVMDDLHAANTNPTGSSFTVGGQTMTGQKLLELARGAQREAVLNNVEAMIRNPSAPLANMPAVEGMRQLGTDPTKLRSMLADLMANPTKQYTLPNGVQMTIKEMEKLNRLGHSAQYAPGAVAKGYFSAPTGLSALKHVGGERVPFLNKVLDMRRGTATLGGIGVPLLMSHLFAPPEAAMTTKDKMIARERQRLAEEVPQGAK